MEATIQGVDNISLGTVVRSGKERDSSVDCNELVFASEGFTGTIPIQRYTN